MRKILVLGALAAALLAVTPAEANGAKRKVSRPPTAVVRVYEPRPAPPLAAINLLGTNLIIWDDLDVDLFDEGDPVPPRVLRMRAPPRVARYRRGR